MKEKDCEILNLFARRLRNHIPDAQIWVFGSRARGDAASESDLDICVVVERLDRKVRAIIRRIAWEVSFENDLVITTVKYSRENFEHGPCSASSLVREILREGIAA